MQRGELGYRKCERIYKELGLNLQKGAEFRKCERSSEKADINAKEVDCVRERVYEIIKRGMEFRNRGQNLEKGYRVAIRGILFQKMEVELKKWVLS